MVDSIFALILQFYILHGNTLDGKQRTLQATYYLTYKCVNVSPSGEDLWKVRHITEEMLYGDLKCIRKD